MSNLAFSPAVHEAAHHPPSDAEQLYADGEGNGNCNWDELKELRVDLLSEGY
jgi:hypothetical protein